MREYAYSALAAVVALGLLALVVWLAGPQQTLRTLERLDVWQALTLIATAFGVSAFTALAWQVILGRSGHSLPVWLLFRLTVLAFAAGWVIPSGFVAGIPVAAYFLKRRGVPFSQGLASFGISRFLEITAYAAILPLALLSEIGSRRTIQVLALLVIAGVVLVYLDLLLHWRLARRGLGCLKRVLPRFAERSLEAAVGFCRDVADFFRAPPGIIVFAAVYSFAAIGIALVRALLTNAFLELGLTTPEVVVMFAITVFLMAVPFLPGAIGAYEGGIAGAFELIGRSKADGLAYALTVHTTELVVVAAGFIVLGHLGFGMLRHERPHAPARGRTRRAHGRA